MKVPEKDFHLKENGLNVTQCNGLTFNLPPTGCLHKQNYTHVYLKNESQLS